MRLVRRRRPQDWAETDRGGPAGRWRDDVEKAGARSKRSARRSPFPALLLIALIVGLIIGLAALAWSQRTMIAGLLSAPESQPVEVAAPEPAPSPPGASSMPTPDATVQAPPAEGRTAGGPKALLFEAQPNAQVSGDTVVSATVDWQFVEDGSSGPEIRADLEVPERGMNVHVVIRRNTDGSLPASHLVEVGIDAPADFPGKGIRSVPGLALKPSERQPHEPLVAEAVKVTDGLFWIALSAIEPAATRNLWLLTERPWIDLPMVYATGQRAILTFEKGQPGAEAFDRAFAAWNKG